MQYRYFYGDQAEKYTFVRIPKQLLTGRIFDSVSVSAKLLYGLFLDRMSVATKNKWMDSNNRLYIIYPISELQSDLGWSKRKITECISELETIGLIERTKQGAGVPNQLYIKNFAIA